MSPAILSAFAAFERHGKTKNPWLWSGLPLSNVAPINAGWLDLRQFGDVLRTSAFTQSGH